MAKKRKQEAETPAPADDATPCVCGATFGEDIAATEPPEVEPITLTLRPGVRVCDLCGGAGCVEGPPVFVLRAGTVENVRILAAIVQSAREREMPKQDLDALERVLREWELWEEARCR